MKESALMQLWVKRQRISVNTKIFCTASLLACKGSIPRVEKDLIRDKGIEIDIKEMHLESYFLLIIISS
jgi:hypothetical protein